MRYIPSLLFFAFICFIIVMADTNHKLGLMKIIEGVPFGDKVGHFMLFGFLAGLINVALKFRRLKIRTLDINMAGVIVLTFAVAEEFTQLAFATRTFELADMLSDVLGVWSFVFLSEWMWRRITKESR
ncbi:VanZ family protein [uncultured Imperialibacter sp.]|uniref:VanZ family protein n=1 Tax=uncultured Imperialibacter sp. TaxID=1672639 RepID=UPI0030DB1A6C|tara:strand:+ start:676 stop:1059 length:384 start_codon:yes stop_codon:yes gene_type:complete